MARSGHAFGANDSTRSGTGTAAGETIKFRGMGALLPEVELSATSSMRLGGNEVTSLCSSVLSASIAAIDPGLTIGHIAVQSSVLILLLSATSIAFDFSVVSRYVDSIYAAIAGRAVLSVT